MKTCPTCGIKRKNKEMLECLYCHNWFCYPNHTDEHLGVCPKDPYPLYKTSKDKEGKDKQ